MLDSEILQWAAKRAAEQPFLLGYDLHEFRMLHDTSEDQLASFLECTRDALICLSLCRRPDSEGSSFQVDIEQIASHCRANPLQLVKLIREVDSLRTMRDWPMHVSHVSGQPGLLAAARDRKGRPRRRKRGGKRAGK